jgi:CubicO group peptidase (beta-lactamase class C family)
MLSGNAPAHIGRNTANQKGRNLLDPAVKSHPQARVPMTINRARICQWTAIGIAAVCLGPASGSIAAEGKAAFPVATPESQGVSTTAVRRVAGEVEEYVKNGTIVGGELLIIKNRKTILHEVYGARDREAKRAMEPGTIFNIRSMTKPLTGVAVQMLADEGKLRLDDPVAKYLPGFDRDKSKAITIEQLLQHRSGLPLTIMTVRVDQYSDLQAQAKAIGEKGPQFKPGEKFSCSDAGSDAAADGRLEPVGGGRLPSRERRSPDRLAWPEE